jgi:hypothetical protein
MKNLIYMKNSITNLKKDEILIVSGAEDCEKKNLQDGFIAVITVIGAVAVPVAGLAISYFIIKSLS